MNATLKRFPIPPVIKVVTVRCAPTTAFRLFTADIGRWYPIKDFSINGAVDCRFDPGIGGRLYEIGGGSQEFRVRRLRKSRVSVTRRCSKAVFQNADPLTLHVRSHRSLAACFAACRST